MHTARTIGLIVGGVVALAMAVAAGLVITLGWGLGVLAVTALGTAAVQGYRLLAQPWHSRWGATDAEATAVLPGDELVPRAGVTTRAVEIDAPAEEVWPWLVQLGFGRAGWYSYDWIDNDGQPSAERLVPELQHLAVGDEIAMTPDQGFLVTRIDRPRTIVAVTPDGTTTWCLRIEPVGERRCRLVSRFRAHFQPTVPGLLVAAVTGPGAFVMERRMLLGIKRRAEAVVPVAELV